MALVWRQAHTKNLKRYRYKLSVVRKPSCGKHDFYPKLNIYYKFGSPAIQNTVFRLKHISFGNYIFLLLFKFLVKFNFIIYKVQFFFYLFIFVDVKIHQHFSFLFICCCFESVGIPVLCLFKICRFIRCYHWLRLVIKGVDFLKLIYLCSLRFNWIYVFFFCFAHCCVCLLLTITLLTTTHWINIYSTSTD